MPGAMDYARVARLYDTYVRTALDVPFWIEEARRSRGDVLELMCGTGRVSVPLAEAGISLTCVDAFDEMLARLRDKLAARGLRATVECADVSRMSLGRRFPLVILPFNSFSELQTPADQQAALRCIADHTAPGGTFICTLHNPAVRLRAADGQLRLLGRFPKESGEGSLVLWAAERHDPREGCVSGMQFYEEYDGGGVLVRKSVVDIRFRVVEREELEAMAAQVGFRVVRMFGDYARAPFDPQTSPFMIWVLSRTA